MEVSLADWSHCTPVYFDQSNYYYDPFRSTYKNLKYTLSTVSKYTVTKSDMGRIMTISYNIYKTTTLWRVLLEYNGINDPISELMPGVVLNCPDKNQAIAYLTNSDNMTSSNSMLASSFII